MESIDTYQNFEYLAWILDTDIRILNWKILIILNQYLISHENIIKYPFDTILIYVDISMNILIFVFYKCIDKY